jgi:hypothetical protein
MEGRREMSYEQNHRHEMEDRKVTLLKAAHALLKKQDNSGYVLNLLSETVFYDDADCDGYCLMEDIASELDIEA